LSLAGAAIPLIAGLGLTLSLADQSLREANIRAGTMAVEQVDRLLMAALGTVEALEPLAGQRCETVLQAMRKEVATNPWLRSASLLYKGLPYCNSVSGKKANSPTVGPEATGPLGDHQLQLRGPNTLYQDFGALAVMKLGATYGVKVTLDNRLLVDRLDLLSGTTDVALHVNGVYLWDDGSLVRGELRQPFRYRASTPSTQFEYEVHSSISAEDVLTLMTHQLVTVIGALAMMSIFTGGLCHWLLTRHRREP
jgi:hypothetical protein